MSAPSGRRERKKAITRTTIADAARRLFLSRGFDGVGIRDIADEADVAVTTLFAHFASKEALVFALDEDFEHRLLHAVAQAPDDQLVPALHREIAALVQHCSTDAAAPVWRMIEQTPALLEYEAAIRVRHAESLANAIAADHGHVRSANACRAVARFIIDAYSLARESADPRRTLDEIFEMIDAAWCRAGLVRPDVET